MEADPLDGVFAACADTRDDVVRVLADGAAGRLRGLGQSIRDGLAMGADSLDGLFAACADAPDDVVSIPIDGAARGLRGVGESISDGFAMVAESCDGLVPALAHPGAGGLRLLDPRPS